jgi:hypothetical protein
VDGWQGVAEDEDGGYFDGDSRNSGWVGNAHASPSASIRDAEDYFISAGLIQGENAGNFEAEPTYTFTGPLSGPIQLTNLDQGTVLQLKLTDLPAGVQRIADVEDDTLEDDSGANVFDDLDLTGDLPIIGAGGDKLRIPITLYGTNDAALISVLLRDSWI